jgi:hypothetical protein
VLTEANRFCDLVQTGRLAQGDAASVAYGLLPFGLFETIRQQFIAAIRARRARVVPRST